MKKADKHAPERSFVFKVLRSLRFRDPEDDEALSESKNEKISTLLTFTNIVYLTLCKYALAPFRCLELPSLSRVAPILQTLNATGEHLDPFTKQTQAHPVLVLQAYPDM